MKIIGIKALAATVAVVFMAATSLNAQSAKFTSSGKFQKDNVLIQQDINNIQADKSRIAYLKDKCKSENKADNKKGVIMTKRDLAKARADLSKDKRYLAADKKDLKQDYRLAIKEHKEGISQDRKDLSNYKKKMNDAVHDGNSSNAQRYAALAVQKQNEIDRKQTAYRNEKQLRNENFASINEDLKESREVSTRAYASTYRNGSSNVAIESRSK